MNTMIRTPEQKQRATLTRNLSALAVSLLTVGALAQVPAFASNANQESAAKHAQCAGHAGERGANKHHAHKRGKHGHKGKHMAMFRGLELSDEQKSQMKALREQQKPAMQGHKQSLRSARKALRDMTVNEQFDAEQARQYAEQLGAAMAAMALQRAAMGEQMMALLSDEQKMKLKQNMENRRQRGDGRK